MESQRKGLEAALNDVTDRADRYFKGEAEADSRKIMTDA
jgi:hypothetical protein